MRQYISDEQIASVMTTRDFVESCDEAFRLYGLGKMLNPLRKEEVFARGGDGSFSSGDAGLVEGEIYGTKGYRRAFGCQDGAVGFENRCDRVGRCAEG